jgi:membrane protease YdiL (CAAX protease family)
VGVAAGITGLVSALVYERSKSLWPSILIHAVNNSLKFILFYALLATSMKLPWI